MCFVALFILVQGMDSVLGRAYVRVLIHFQGITVRCVSTEVMDGKDVVSFVFRIRHVRVMVDVLEQDLASAMMDGPVKTARNAV